MPRDQSNVWPRDQRRARRVHVRNDDPKQIASRISGAMKNLREPRQEGREWQMQKR